MGFQLFFQHWGETIQQRHDTIPVIIVIPFGVFPSYGNRRASPQGHVYPQEIAGPFLPALLRETNGS